MGSVDDRSNLSPEGEEQLSRGKTMTESQREKRKSEVLIAAQSIENEVQSVKSLKRISIGSIDLLIDPEMEFRVSSPSKRKSWSSNSSSSGDEANPEQTLDSDGGSSVPNEENNDTVVTEGLENSFDFTSADYLQGINSSQDSSDIESSTSFTQRSELSRNSTRRTLTGVGSLRRAGVSTPTGDNWSPAPTNEEGSNSGSSITNQLFWVPADQHPNVKPENYLELVQDTLHNIQLDDTNETRNHDESSSSNFAGFERKPIDIARKHDSLVRRPSLLRKSYTEFEDYSDEDEEENKHNSFQKTAEFGKDFKKVNRGSRRAVSLKDITEELTRISNNAGLTSSDAITLARTLSMAGTYSNTNISSTMDSPATSEQRSISAYNAPSTDDNDEGEFASNMLTRHGVVIPARSSLRRSKFNTYRIRSSGSITSPDGGDKNIERDGALTSRIERKPISRHAEKILSERPQNQTDQTSSKLSSVKQTESIATSPSTISDLQEIYDHYRQPAAEGDKEPDKQPSKQAQITIPEAHEKSRKKDHESLKTDSTSDNQESSVPTSDRASSEKKSGWSWLNGITSRDSSTEKQAKSDERETKPSRDESSVTKDFARVSDSTRTQSEKLSNHRIDHSKNRHLPIFNAKETTALDPQQKEKEPVGITKESNLPTPDSSNLKRQKFEKKFVNLFKRKARNKSTGHRSPKNVVKSEAHSGGHLQNETKNDAPFKISKLKSESRAEEQLRNVQTSIGRSDDGQDHWGTPENEADQLPALQPAVSVTSTKGNHTCAAEPSVVESVRELDGDDSQDISGDQSVNSGIDLMQEALVMREQPKEEPALAVRDKHVMPPRKLTFDDVKKPERPNAAMKFTDSAFGFPLPMLTVSTVIMFDHRLPINVERAIYRLSHLKLSDPKRELRQQVILSNFMYAYLNLVNHTLYMEQAAQEDSSVVIDSSSGSSAIPSKSATYQTEHNSANGSICIPDI